MLLGGVGAYQTEYHVCILCAAGPNLRTIDEEMVTFIFGSCLKTCEV